MVYACVIGVFFTIFMVTGVHLIKKYSSQKKINFVVYLRAILRPSRAVDMTDLIT